MSAASWEVLLVAVVVAVATALPGVFLVLRRMAMMSDAISHSILLGIVLAFFVVQDLTSPLLIFGAAAMGVVTVSLVELLGRTRLLHEDASIGIVFPFLFSIGIILITRFAGDVHLDTDAVLLGDLAFVPFDRFTIGSLDLGPRALWVMLGILLLNVLFIALFYKELKLATFDAGLAASLGFSPVLIHYSLMALVSLTAVGAFDAVGSLLVVALMIAPAAAAYLWTDRLAVMLLLAALFGILSAVAGYFMARLLDASIAGSMATLTGVVFLLSFALSPSRGVLLQLLRRRRQTVRFSGQTLLIHLLHHEGRPEELEENRLDHLWQHFHWEPRFARTVVSHLVRHGWVLRESERLKLTEEGRGRARRVMVKI